MTLLKAPINVVSKKLVRFTPYRELKVGVINVYLLSFLKGGENRGIFRNQWAWDEIAIIFSKLFGYMNNKAQN